VASIASYNAVPLVERLGALVRLPSAKAVGHWRYRLQVPLFASPFYGWILRQPTASEARSVTSEPWPGDVERGEAMVAGVFTLAGHTQRLAPSVWLPANAPAPWIEALHGFEWLRDLKACGSDDARRTARELTRAWIGRYRHWHPVVWHPATTGRRLAAWFGQYDFFCLSAEAPFRQKVLQAAARQAHHLSRVLPAGLTGAELIAAIKGMVFAGLAVPGGESWARRGLALLERELARQVLADGTHYSRSPRVHLAVLRDLVDLRSAVAAAALDPPGYLALTIDHMGRVLRMLSHGDGGLACFNDSDEGNPTEIRALIKRADSGRKPLLSAPHGGYQRLQVKRTAVIVDAGAPPPAGLDRHAHAGTLAFEMSVATQRLIVNCGALVHNAEWRAAQRATAAHSTVVVGERNAMTILPDGGVGRRPEHVVCRRDERVDGVLLDMSHDGYKQHFGVVVGRRLFLAADGEALYGEDRVEGRGGGCMVSRFHLHPDVQASVVQNGRSVLLRMANGTGWRLSSHGAEIALADSVYLGTGEVRRTQQVTLAAAIAGAETAVTWALVRERKG
jgi:uncharacterized heparinase superfamily protein